MVHWLAAVSGKQPDGRFRPGIIVAPYAEHDLAHYVIDAFTADRIAFDLVVSPAPTRGAHALCIRGHRRSRTA
jgi:hypothetical protein